MNEDLSSRVVELFPFFSEIMNSQDEIVFTIKTIPKASRIFNEGDSCEMVAFVLEGIIRVSKVGKNGREVMLYRVKSGDTCILTIASVLSDIVYPATATAEEHTEVLLVSIAQYKQWMEIGPGLQQYVSKILAERFLNVMTRIEQLMFRSIDERVIDYIVTSLQGDGDILEITHDELAKELGTAREVISRVLKNMEQKGDIKLSRGKIKLINRCRLIEKLSVC